MFIDGKEIKAIRQPVKYRVIQTLLISAVDGAILKSFDVVRAMIRWFDIMYHKPWLGTNHLSKTCNEVWTDFKRVFE